MQCYRGVIIYDSSDGNNPNPAFPIWTFGVGVPGEYQGYVGVLHAQQHIDYLIANERIYNQCVASIPTPVPTPVPTPEPTPDIPIGTIVCWKYSNVSGRVSSWNSLTNLYTVVPFDSTQYTSQGTSGELTIGMCATETTTPGCTPNWECGAAIDGISYDGCGNKRFDSSCISVPEPTPVPTPVPTPDIPITKEMGGTAIKILGAGLLIGLLYKWSKKTK